MPVISALRMVKLEDATLKASPSYTESARQSNKSLSQNKTKAKQQWENKKKMSNNNSKFTFINLEQPLKS